jgi:DNA-binding CsgD family transcriptional regulator
LQRTDEAEWSGAGDEIDSVPGGAARWEAAARAARTIAPAAAWRESLAARLHEAAREHHALVFTCPLNQPELGRFAASPAAAGPIIDRIMAEYLPQLERQGEGWPRLYQRCGAVVPVLDALAGLLVTQRLRHDLFAPAGVAGLLCAWLVTRQGELAGWLNVATVRPEAEALAELGEPLRWLAERATHTLTATIDLAQSCGATFPEPPAGAAGLSGREREIVGLVIEGLSDVNIAARLAIAEATVGSHLARIYRKLGVHSRVELVIRARAR